MTQRRAPIDAAAPEAGGAVVHTPLDEHVSAYPAHIRTVRGIPVMDEKSLFEQAQTELLFSQDSLNAHLEREICVLTRDKGTDESIEKEHATWRRDLQLLNVRIERLTKLVKRRAAILASLPASGELTVVGADVQAAGVLTQHAQGTSK